LKNLRNTWDKLLGKTTINRESLPNADHHDKGQARKQQIAETTHQQTK
jgi:hypothetical protein